MYIFALTTRGLEPFSADELSALPGTQAINTAYRRVEADFTGDLATLLNLKTVDDVFLHLTTWDEVKHTRDMLPRFIELSRELDLESAVDVLSEVRAIPAQPTFSITVNYVGKRNYSAPEVKALLAESVTDQHINWHYADDDRAADLNLRLFIQHDTALVGLRIGESPLHRRDYKQFHVPGALKPPVANAMLMLADVSAGMTLVDPFCGSGTIVIEAAQAEITSYGGDIDQTTLRGALQNNEAAAQRSTVVHWDAQQLPFADSSVNCVVSNMPWGRQVQVDAALETLYRRAFAEMQRILVAGGKIVLLTTFPELIGQAPYDSLEISLFGQNPNIVTFEKGQS